jgi:hypothetical protein
VKEDHSEYQNLSERPSHVPFSITSCHILSVEVHSLSCIYDLECLVSRLDITFHWHNLLLKVEGTCWQWIANVTLQAPAT